jgi:hypothetical protein
MYPGMDEFPAYQHAEASLSSFPARGQGPPSLPSFPARGQCGFPFPGRKEESRSLGRGRGQGVRLSLLPRTQMYWHYLNTGGRSDQGMRPRAHRSLGRAGKTRRWNLIYIRRLGRKQGRGGEPGEQLVEEVVPENVRMLDVGCNRAVPGDVSGCTAPETGAWESARSGPVNVHSNDRWKHGSGSRGEQDRSVRGRRNQEDSRSTRPR